MKNTDHSFLQRPHEPEWQWYTSRFCACHPCTGAMLPGLFDTTVLLNRIGKSCKCFRCDVKHASEHQMESLWFRRNRWFIWEGICVTMAVLGLNWIGALALQGLNLKRCLVFGTMLFSPNQRRSEICKLAYFRNFCIVLFAHSMAEQSKIERTQCFSIKMFQENPQHPALLCEQDLKQDCVRAKRPPRNFQHFDLSPIGCFWKDCSSALHWRQEAVRVLWSHSSAADCWTAVVPGGRSKNSWGSKAYKLATDVVGGADLHEALFSNMKQWKILARFFFGFAQRQ